MRLSEKLSRLEGEPTPTRSPKNKSAVDPVAAVKKRVRAKVLEEVAPTIAGRTTSSAELRAEVTATVDAVLEQESARVSPKARKAFVEELASDIVGFGPLDPFLADGSVTEVMCNAHDDIWVERGGVIERTDVAFADHGQYRAVIDRIVAGVGRRLDESSPMVDARLPDGSWVNVVIPPLARWAPILTVRKFRTDPFRTKDLINMGTVSMELALFLEACVRGRQNILISGGTGSGKTTTLNVLSSFIPENERIITIEDVMELRLSQPHVVPLEYRPPNVEGRGEVRIRDLVRNALRMRPDRIVVGECRGGEALDMLQAMNTGHEGSLTTVHANTGRDALSRLETMVLMAGFDLPVRAIREQIASALDLVVQQERSRDGHRRVVEVSEVQGMEGDTITLQKLFSFDHRTGKITTTGLRPRLLEKLEEHGVPIPEPWGNGQLLKLNGAKTNGAKANGSRAKAVRR